MGLLDDLVRGAIRSDDPDRLAEQIVDHWHLGNVGGSLEDALGLTANEYTAWAPFGASLRLLMKWRVSGWPSDCGLCGQPIAAEDWAIFEKEGGEQMLTHLRCWSTETKKEKAGIIRR